MREHLEKIARAQAHRAAMEKTAGPILNPAVLGGAGLGTAIGAYRGAKGSREGEKGYGALTGALLGGVAGGAAGHGARTLYKNVPAGWKQISKGKEELAKELQAKNIIKPEGKSYFSPEMKKYREQVKKYVTGERETMREAVGKVTNPKAAGTEAAKAEAATGTEAAKVEEKPGFLKRLFGGKKSDAPKVEVTPKPPKPVEAPKELRGKELSEAIDKTRGEHGAVGQLQMGREKLYGGLIGGGVGLGYGAYQLKDTKNINAPVQGEKPIRDYLRRVDHPVAKSSIRAAQNVGRHVAASQGY